MKTSEYYMDTLSNGLRIMTVEMPHLHSVEMSCYLGVGGRHEVPENAGISHFLEHILFRGTADFPSSLELEHAFEAIGGAVNASTDQETTCYHSRLHPDHIREGAAIFASMLRRPLFREIDLERRIILEEALEDLNERGEDINPDNLTARLLWPGHPLSLPTIGTRESISRLTEEDLQRHHQLYYSPENLVIGIAGKVRREGVVEAVEKAFGTWKGGKAPKPRAVTSINDQAPAITWVRDSASQVHIQFAFGMPGRYDPRSIPLRVLRRVLSGGGTSRLMLHLRENLGLTYHVEANLALFEESGCFTVDLAAAPANLVRAVDEVIAIFQELHRNPVGKDELGRVIRNFLFDLDYSRDSTEDMAVRYGWGELVGCLRTVEDDRREVARVTSDDLQATVRDLFLPGNLKMAVVGPYRSRDQKKVEDLLKGAGERLIPSLPRS